MGIYGAMSTAVAGLRSQSFALENISGNIANVQTTGYKRVETSFSDLVPDSNVGRVGPSSVQAKGRQTLNVQGDLGQADVSTFMGISGDGFFSIRAKSDTVDGNPVFGDQQLYTRRGDFDFDKQGYLVNGAGYYLMGLSVDPQSGNISGTEPEPIRVTNDFIPAKATNRVSLHANLPKANCSTIPWSAAPVACPPTTARPSSSNRSRVVPSRCATPTGSRRTCRCAGRRSPMPTRPPCLPWRTPGTCSTSPTAPPRARTTCGRRWVSTTRSTPPAI